MEVKEREVLNKALKSETNGSGGIPGQPTVRDYSVYSRQSTTYDHSLWLPLQGWKKVRDQFHPDYQAPLEKLDVGTQFYTWKREYQNSLDSVDLFRDRGNGEWYSYKGPVRAYGQAGVVNDGSGSWPAQIGLLAGDKIQYLQGLGSTAIARCVPTNPHSSLAVALGELRKEGLPKIVGAQLWKDGLSGSSVAKENLNIQFGILPLAREIHDMSKATIRSAELIKQFERDAGRNVRRSYYFPEKKTETVEDLGLQYPIAHFPSTRLFPSSTSIRGPLIKTTRVVERVWFKGAFTYSAYGTKSNDLSAQLIRAAQQGKYLYGLGINPEVAFELTGWSWLADWFVNAGDLIHNLVAFGSDGLVMRYGYVMCTTYTEHEYVHTSQFFGTITTTYRTIEKIRLKATPYGFGVDQNSLTAGQIDILASLGLSGGRPRRSK